MAAKTRARRRVKPLSLGENTQIRGWLSLAEAAEAIATNPDATGLIPVLARNPYFGEFWVAIAPLGTENGRMTTRFLTKYDEIATDVFDAPAGLITEE